MLHQATFETRKFGRGAQGVSCLDPRRKEKIKAEIKRAEEYLSAAELLQKHALYSASATSSYYASCHAATAAFLTMGADKPHGEQFTGFVAALARFNSKLDPFVDKLRVTRQEWGMHVAPDYTEGESLLRFYQTRDFLLEIRDYLRRAVRS